MKKPIGPIRFGITAMNSLSFSFPDLKSFSSIRRSLNILILGIVFVDNYGHYGDFLT